MTLAQVGSIGFTQTNTTISATAVTSASWAAHFKIKQIHYSGDLALVMKLDSLASEPNSLYETPEAFQGHLNRLKRS